MLTLPRSKLHDCSFPSPLHLIFCVLNMSTSCKDFSIGGLHAISLCWSLRLVNLTCGCSETQWHYDPRISDSIWGNCYRKQCSYHAHYICGLDGKLDVSFGPAQTSLHRAQFWPEPKTPTQAQWAVSPVPVRVRASERRQSPGHHATISRMTCYNSKSTWPATVYNSIQ